MNSGFKLCNQRQSKCEDITREGVFTLCTLGPDCDLKQNSV